MSPLKSSRILPAILIACLTLGALAAALAPPAKEPAISNAELDALEKKIESLIEEVRRLRAEAGGSQMQTWTVTFDKLNVAWLVKAVKPIIEGRGGTITAGENNSITIEAPRSKLPGIKQFIFKLEAELAGPAPDGVTTYPLKHMKPDEMVTMLNRLLAGSKWETPLTADARTQSVTVKGPRASREYIGQLIAELDRAKEDTDIVTVYALKTARAAAIADALITLLDDKRTQVSYDERSNLIILHATPKRAEEVRQLLNALDNVKKEDGR